MSAPKEIDRARVLNELVHRWDETAGSKADDEPGVKWVLDQLADLDILAYRNPVDDPSKDPIGTVRHERHDDDSGHSIWLCTQDRHGRRGWFCVYSTAVGNQGGRMDDDEVAGLPVVDALLGTPAAEPESAERSAGCQNHWPVSPKQETRPLPPDTVLHVHHTVWKALVAYLDSVGVAVHDVSLHGDKQPTFFMDPKVGAWPSE